MDRHGKVINMSELVIDVFLIVRMTYDKLQKAKVQVFTKKISSPLMSKRGP